MNYYYIIPNTPVGNTAILTDNIKSYFSKDLSSYTSGSLVLEMDSFDYHDSLFALHPFHFVTEEFKGILERKEEFKLDFQKVDVFIAGDNLMDSHPHHGFNEKSFWRLSVDEKNIHVKIYSSMLIVSDIFLDFMITNKAFKYSISGGHYGKEFEFINNIFRLRGTIEEYFNLYYKDDFEFIRNKQKCLIEMSKRS